jgi:hypothetical protein
MFSKVMQVAFLLALVAFISAWSYDFYLDSNFINYSHLPNPMTAQIVPYKWKSITIYVSRAQFETLEITHAVEVISLLLAGAYFVVRRVRRTGHD